jgi:hypothetical protein
MPDVNSRLRTVINDIRSELREAEKWHCQNLGESVNAVRHFDEWLESLFARMRRNLVKWMNDMADFIILATGT